MRLIFFAYFLLLFSHTNALAVSCHSKLLQLLDQAKLQHHNVAAAIHPMGSVKVTIPRVGKYRGINSDNRLTFLHEIEIDQLLPVHPIPNPYRPGSAAKLDELMDALEFEGFNLKFPIQVALMPNGELRLAGGHHRAEALRQLGDKYVPSEIIIWSQLDPMTRKLYVDEFFKPYSLAYPEYYQSFLANPALYY